MEHQENQEKFLEYFIQGAKNLGLSFNDQVLENFCLYFMELNFWNRSVNLTSLKTEQEQAVLLFVDSLAGILGFSKANSLSIIDIGTGGGFPGIPLKLAFPSLKITLLEPRANKTAFLHTVIGKLGLKGISVLQKRLESCSPFTNDDEKWDIAVSKAVRLESILPYFKNVLKKDGKLIVFRATNIENPERLGGVIIEREISYELPYEFGTRVLSVLKQNQ